MVIFPEIQDFDIEEIMSVNHSRSIQRIGTYLERYNEQFDILPELEIKLNGKPLKPDISIYPHLPEDWNTDIIFLTEPPITAIEILSPRQAMTDITDKMTQNYFPSGVKSVWIVIPLLQTLTICTPDGEKITFSKGVATDPITHIEIPLNHIFGKRVRV